MEMNLMRDGETEHVALPMMIWRVGRQTEEKQFLCIISDLIHIEALAGHSMCRLAL
jgi:hypothetical protein